MRSRQATVSLMHRPTASTRTKRSDFQKRVVEEQADSLRLLVEVGGHGAFVAAFCNRAVGGALSAVEDLHNRPAVALGDRVQLAALIGGRLLGRRNAQITLPPLWDTHTGIPAFTDKILARLRLRPTSCMRTAAG
jgi:hypothetical protein